MYTITKSIGRCAASEMPLALRPIAFPRPKPVVIGVPAVAVTGDSSVLGTGAVAVNSTHIGTNPGSPPRGVPR